MRRPLHRSIDNRSQHAVADTIPCAPPFVWTVSRMVGATLAQARVRAGGGGDAGGIGRHKRNTRQGGDDRGDGA